MSDNPEVVTAPAETPKDTVEVVHSTETTEPKGTEPQKEPDSAPQQDTPEQQEQKKNSRNQQRKAERDRLIRENAEIKERLRAFEEANKPKETQEAKPKDFSKKPNAADYADDKYMDYVEDLAAFKANELLTGREKAAQEADKQKKVQAYQEKIQTYIEQDPKFGETIDKLYDQGLIPAHIEDAVITAPDSDELTKHLVKYPADLVKLNQMRPEFIPQALNQIREFMKKGGVAEEKPRQTQASAPITPVSNVAKTDRSLESYTKEELENMPQSEFNAKFMKKRY